MYKLSYRYPPPLGHAWEHHFERESMARDWIRAFQGIVLDCKLFDPAGQELEVVPSNNHFLDTEDNRKKQHERGRADALAGNAFGHRDELGTAAYALRKAYSHGWIEGRQEKYGA
jgi:hypothetical protein